MSLALALSGCASEPLEQGDPGKACDFGHERQAYTLGCLKQSLDPVTDSESPDFGRVNCKLIEIGKVETDFCSCALPGFAPATGEQIANAYAFLDANGECRNACCDDVCCCELLQLSGDELVACQGGDNTRVTVDRQGWCYVEPDLGIGDPSTVSACAPDARHGVLLTPIMSTHYDIMSCETAPG